MLSTVQPGRTPSIQACTTGKPERLRPAPKQPEAGVGQNTQEGVFFFFLSVGSKEQL